MSPPAESLVRIYPSAPLSARQARDFVAAELHRLNAGPDVVEDLVLIVSELVANSIQHGDGSGITVTIDPESAHSLSVTVGSGVASQRPPTDPQTWSMAGPGEPSGRGLGIVRQLADEITVTLTAGRLEITCRRHR